MPPRWTFAQNAYKVFLTDRHSDDSAEFAAIPPHCRTARKCAPVPTLARYADAVVTKDAGNGIFRLQKSADIARYENFVFVGCCTDIDIPATAVALRSLADEARLPVNVAVSRTAARRSMRPNMMRRRYPRSRTASWTWRASASSKK